MCVNNNNKIISFSASEPPVVVLGDDFDEAQFGVGHSGFGKLNLLQNDVITKLQSKMYFCIFISNSNYFSLTIVFININQ